MLVIPRSTSLIQGPSMPGCGPRHAMLLPNLTLRVWLMMSSALSELILISLAHSTFAAIGARSMPEMQCTYALSPWIKELTTQACSAWKSAALALGLEISKRKAKAPGMHIPAPPGDWSTLAASMSFLKQYI